MSICIHTYTYLMPIPLYIYIYMFLQSRNVVSFGVRNDLVNMKVLFVRIGSMMINVYSIIQLVDFFDGKHM